MHSLVCFTHSDQLIQSLHQELHSSGHNLPVVLAPVLNDRIREVVRQQRPVLALVEAISFSDVLAFYIFLRSDPTTQDIPVIFLSKDQRIQQYASIFADDKALHTLATKDQFFQRMWYLLHQGQYLPTDAALLEAEVSGASILAAVSMSA